jgi:hypothetical protein
MVALSLNGGVDRTAGILNQQRFNNENELLLWVDQCIVRSTVISNYVMGKARPGQAKKHDAWMIQQPQPAAVLVGETQRRLLRVFSQLRTN